MKKNVIVYGNCNNPIAKKAVEVLSEFLHDYSLEYPVCIKADELSLSDDMRYFFIGTKADNSYISENCKNELKHREEYSITVKNDNIYIEGFDYQGLLYAAVDFYNNYILKYEYSGEDSDRYVHNIFEKALPDFSCTSHPAIAERGIWTWGHVIYEYKAFFENMLKLKMNTVVIWNDYAPLNGKEIVDYAHSCGIKVIWGYSWMWDTDCGVFLQDGLEYNPTDYLDKYEREYGSFCGDGVYFQSFTEKNVDTINGIVIAEAVTEFVNKTSALFFEKYPDIELQFGLHATSVKEKLQYIKNVNPKVRIVWEDCGAFPFHYLPNKIEGFDETCDFVSKIATLRGKADLFGVVTKGFTKLDWTSFEHLHGSVMIGASSKYVKANRIARKSKDWKFLQGYWLKNADKAYDMVRLMSKLKKGDIYVTALVEDGMFEENAMYPVALFAEMLWDNDIELKEMMKNVALRSYVTFA